MFVLGVYPSALHVRWTLPEGGRVVGALAVADEPTVFWDGGDEDELIARWRAEHFDDAWGTVGPATGNGSSGRKVVDHVLEPLGIDADAVWLTDCLPTYFVKSGTGSQGAAMREVYDPFAASVPTLQSADLPSRPTPRALVRRAVEEEANELLRQIAEADAPTIVTLGQEAADVLAAITGADRVVLDLGPAYGERREITAAGRRRGWIPVTHPGNRAPSWAQRHRRWMGAASC